MEKKWWQVLSENSPLALTLIGGVLFMTGVAGGWPTPQVKVSEPGWRIASAAMGAIALAIGIFLMFRKETRTNQQIQSDLVPSLYGIRITSPAKGDDVGKTFDVKGEYTVRPPSNIVVKVLDLSPASGAYWPKTALVTFEDDKTWKARSIGIGRLDHGVERIIVVAIMEKGGQALCSYYEEVAKVINQARKEFDEKIKLPGIVAPSPDIVECHRVTVRGE